MTNQKPRTSQKANKNAAQPKIVDLEFLRADYLYILERELLIKKSWKFRYFVLDKNILNYYEDDERQKRLAQVQINEVNDVTMLPNHLDRENVLVVSRPTQVLND